MLAAGYGSMTPTTLSSIDVDVLEKLIRLPPSLHRFPRKMAKWIRNAATQVETLYQGDAARIWSDGLGAHEVIRRFDRFEGIAQKKSTMATNILARDYEYPITGWADIDVSYDVHVRRVFLRSGLASRDSADAIVAAARELYPRYPGNLDLGAWDIGKNWCRPSNPQCGTCPLASDCPRLLDVRVPRS